MCVRESVREHTSMLESARARERERERERERASASERERKRARTLLSHQCECECEGECESKSKSENLVKLNCLRFRSCWVRLGGGRCRHGFGKPRVLQSLLGRES